MTTTPTAPRAHRLYTIRCQMIRARFPRASREFAAAMSDAARKYEQMMKQAAASGDAQAQECVAASEGPYLSAAGV